ncbi:SRPBCC domain-containing protein [Tsukamurella sp. 1534]|uniref:SRPBCC domain-containing protein n=1 Tax=Tsukamurella sp. 1534 TaxID=1151061 RepID=UPI0002F914A1|nr:SRPBCC domain-containing protein [Tsukamurella sp. 1534]
MRRIVGTTVVALLFGVGVVALYGERIEERSIDIEAPPGVVWSVLVDFAAYPEWNPFIRYAVAPSGLAVGQRLDVRIANHGSETGFRPEVLAATPKRELRWLGRVVAPGILDGEHAFEVEETRAGTRVTQREHFRGVLVPVAGSALDVGDAFDAMNRALRERVLATIAR